MTLFVVCQELEKMQLKHQEELGKRLKMNINTEKKLIKEVSQVNCNIFSVGRKFHMLKRDSLVCLLRKYKNCLCPRAMRLNAKPSRQR